MSHICHPIRSVHTYSIPELIELFTSVANPETPGSDAICAAHQASIKAGAQAALEFLTQAKRDGYTGLSVPAYISEVAPPLQERERKPFDALRKANEITLSRG